MSDEQTKATPDPVPENVSPQAATRRDRQGTQLPPELQKLTRTVEVAEGPNTDAHEQMVKSAHASADDVGFIVHEDGSKSVPYADAPHRRAED